MNPEHVKTRKIWNIWKNLDNPENLEIRKIWNPENLESGNPKIRKTWKSRKPGKAGNPENVKIRKIWNIWKTSKIRKTWKSGKPGNMKTLENPENLEIRKTSKINFEIFRIGNLVCCS